MSLSPPGFAAFDTRSESEIIKTYSPLVKKIALHLDARLPDSVQIDDLIQAGLIGLLAASKAYDSSKGAKFETYAGTRIRGAMLDEVRGSDWTPRSTSKQMRDISSAIHTVEARTQRKATDREIARELGVSLPEYHHMSSDIASSRLLSAEELHEMDGDSYADTPSQEKKPDDLVHETDLEKALIQAIDDLPEKEQLVMSLYYDEEMNLREIGAVLGVSESRISQLHGQAVARMRNFIDQTMRTS